MRKRIFTSVAAAAEQDRLMAVDLLEHLLSVGDRLEMGNGKRWSDEVDGMVEWFDEWRERRAER